MCEHSNRWQFVHPIPSYMEMSIALNECTGQTYYWPSSDGPCACCDRMETPRNNHPLCLQCQYFEEFPNGPKEYVYLGGKFFVRLTESLNGKS